MTAYVLTDAQGAVVSIGTVVTSPLPQGITANQISDADFDAIRQGLKRWSGGAIVDTTLAAQNANVTTIRTGLGSFFADAAAAQTTITNLLAQAAPGAGTLTTAQLSTIVRALDTSLRSVATIEQGVIKRAVALVRLMIDAVDTTDGTT